MHISIYVCICIGLNMSSQASDQSRKVTKRGKPPMTTTMTIATTNTTKYTK